MTSTTIREDNALLAKLRGALVLIKVSRCEAGTHGRCPACGGSQFRDLTNGWTECDSCHDFAVDTLAYKRLVGQP